MQKHTINYIAANMYETAPLLDTWIRENNDLVNKWKQKQKEANCLRQDEKQSFLKCLSSEFHKLLSKIQGAPPLAGLTQLEMTVMYNAAVFSVTLSEFSDMEILITNIMGRVLQIPGYDQGSSDCLLFWRNVSEKSLKHTELSICLGQLFCLQWAIWLATQKFSVIQELEKELPMFFNTLFAESNGSERLDTLLLVLEPKDLIELLHVCTFIARGAEKLAHGQSSDAFIDIQKATSLPAPRALVAYMHLLLGSCFVQKNCPQMALQCYRKALETDLRCVSALYQSMLIYRQLGNTEAEIEALKLLHSALVLTSSAECDVAGVQLISPCLVLCSSSLNDLLSVPSALTILHSLALKCVLYGRVSEGVENYLDLLATLHSNQQNPQLNAKMAFLTSLTELYLEAGAAMLLAKRSDDCIALCDEVLGTTLDLLPERVVLEDSDMKPELKPSNICVNQDNTAAMLLWAGAAYLLQAHCYIHLKDWKQAITHYTRCVNLIVKVRYKKKGCPPQIISTDIVEKERTELFNLQRLKGLSLAGRGICFAETDHWKEALRDLQLSLNAFPECVGAGLWCGEVLLRLGRREEAVSCWKKTRSFQSFKQAVCVYLQEPPTDHLLNPSEIDIKMQEVG